MKEEPINIEELKKNLESLRIQHRETTILVYKIEGAIEIIEKLLKKVE